MKRYTITSNGTPQPRAYRSWGRAVDAASRLRSPVVIREHDVTRPDGAGWTDFNILGDYLGCSDTTAPADIARA